MLSFFLSSHDNGGNLILIVPYPTHEKTHRQHAGPKLGKSITSFSQLDTCKGCCVHVYFVCVCECMLGLFFLSLTLSFVPTLSQAFLALCKMKNPQGDPIGPRYEGEVYRTDQLPQVSPILLDLGLALEVLAGNKLGNIVVIGLLALLVLLHALVALSELAQRGQGVGAQLVQDTGDELGQLLVLTVSVDGEGVGGDSSVDWYI